MKKLLILAAAALMFSCTQQQTVKIEGNVEGLGDMVWFMPRTGAPVDSATVTDGHFTFTEKMSEEIRMYIANAPSLMDADFTQMIIMEPGTITVTCPEGQQKATVSGTPANDGYFTAKAKLNELEDKYYDAETDEEQEKAEQEYNAYQLEAYKANRDNAAGLILLRNLSYEDITGQELADELNLFPDNLKNIKEWKDLMDIAEKGILTANGQPYLDFTQNDPNGNPISLKSVVEKEGNRYVLLDFWASWCGPCMGEVPYLVQDYADFHKLGFEIFGTSLDQSRDKWTDAIADKKMDWVHVSDVKYWDNEAAKLYGVSAIPTNYLIDCKTGLIIAKNLRGEAVRETLQKLFAEALMSDLVR